MYFDLFHPFPISEDADDSTSSSTASKKKKGKGKAVVNAGSAAMDVSADGQGIGRRKNCWEGLESGEKDRFARRVALAGHLGYSVLGCTIAPREPSSTVIPCPFTSSLPFPDLDPRFASSSSSSSAATSSGSSRPPMVQVFRYHMRLSDNKGHCLTNQNTNVLRAYDILSVAPLTDKAFQLACTDMSNPGPNQISIITLPLHERPFTFRFNRKQMRQAQRNGVVFELLYSAALFPSASLPPDIARRYRQNFLSNAREVVRITGGKGIIFSSGPGVGSNEIGLRGPLDIINLGTMLGMPSNLAKEAVEKAPRMVLLRAQARRTFKAIMSMPKLVRPVETSEVVQDQNGQQKEVHSVKESLAAGERPHSAHTGKRPADGVVSSPTSLQGNALKKVKTVKTKAV